VLAVAHVFFQFWCCIGISNLTFNVGGNCTSWNMKLRVIVAETWNKWLFRVMVILEDIRCFVSINIQLSDQREFGVYHISVLMASDMGEG
jgi:hypothetical protein